ncbi:XRE family transcriptional regulator [Actinocorallia herbida]|uniref:XRE family transcriptional regulator n=1 Tax=Actinocorallia herbida TaxID=58109 RepID=A0A3N1CXW9_9ACTN|nr:XRE family transcriptional regulator [Actinocorallia herbida]ROO86139.1 XRE family transcriptional regulator [Actinocorallia herbida]
MPNPTQPPTSDAYIAESIGRQVRELRERAGLSVTGLAAACGVSQPYVSQIEKGAASPSLSTVYRLAKALGARPGDLLPPLSDDGEVTVVRSDEGELVPISDRPDTGHGRILLSHRRAPLSVFEYVLQPDQYVGEWFGAPGVSAIYVVSGTLEVEVAGHGVYTLGPRDFISLADNVFDRWKVLGTDRVHLVLSYSPPPGAPEAPPRAAAAP